MSSFLAATSTLNPPWLLVNDRQMVVFHFADQGRQNLLQLLCLRRERGSTMDSTTTQSSLCLSLRAEEGTTKPYLLYFASGPCLNLKRSM